MLKEKLNFDGLPNDNGGSCWASVLSLNENEGSSTGLFVLKLNFDDFVVVSDLVSFTAVGLPNEGKSNNGVLEKVNPEDLMALVLVSSDLFGLLNENDGSSNGTLEKLNPGTSATGCKGVVLANTNFELAKGSTAVCGNCKGDEYDCISDA